MEQPTKPSISQGLGRRSTLLLVLLLVVGVSVGILFFANSNKQVKTSKPGQIITYSTDKPDESKKNAQNYKWQGAADEPKRITIDKSGVDGFIQKAGVDQNKQIAVPDNVHLAAWFADSVLPGKKGLSIIDGHVSGKTTDGIFKNIKNLTKGDLFQVELGNGKELQYKVLETVELKESQSASYLFSQNPKVASQLNLITCGGNFDRATNQYQNRIIVAAELQ